MQTVCKSDCVIQFMCDCITIDTVDTHLAYKLWVRDNKSVKMSDTGFNDYITCYKQINLIYNM